jgi:hypothetical protein
MKKRRKVKRLSGADVLNMSLESLEARIDTGGLVYLLNQAAQVCYLKADHIIENWQDIALSKTWERVGAKIEKLADSIVDSI